MIEGRKTSVLMRARSKIKFHFSTYALFLDPGENDPNGAGELWLVNSKFARMVGLRFPPLHLRCDLGQFIYPLAISVEASVEC